MAGSLNKIMIIGNVGRDPEMRYTPNGSAVTSFSVATNYRRNGPDGQPIDETEWFNVVTWNKLAETCSEYVKKGRSVFVEGRLRTRSWDGQDGQKHYRTEVIAQDVRFLDSGQSANRPPRTENGPARPQDDFDRGMRDLDKDMDVDEIPF